MRVWVKVSCDKCDRYLGEILLDTDAYCNKCDRWTKAEKEEKPCRKGKSMIKEN